MSLSHIIREEHGIQCMPCSFRIISEMLLEIHTIEKCDVLKSIIHSQIIQSSVMCASIALALVMVYLYSIISDKIVYAYSAGNILDIISNSL